jgi:hypothetical protein
MGKSAAHCMYVKCTIVIVKSRLVDINVLVSAILSIVVM